MTRPPNILTFKKAIRKYGVEHRIPSGTTAFAALVATLAEGQTAPLDALVAAITGRISAETAATAVTAVAGVPAGVPAGVTSGVPSGVLAAAAPNNAPLATAITAAMVQEKLLVVSERNLYGLPLAPGPSGDKVQLKMAIPGAADGERILLWEARNPLVLPSSDSEKKLLVAAKKLRKGTQAHIKSVLALVKLLRYPSARRAAASAAIAKAEAGVRKHEAKLEAAKTKRLAAERKASAAAAAKEEKATMLRIQKVAAAKVAAEKKKAREAAKDAAKVAAAAAKEEREAARAAAAAKKRVEKEAAAAAKEAKKLAAKEAAAKKAHIAKTAGSASILSMFKTLPKPPSPAKAKAAGAASPGPAAAPCAAELARIAALHALDAALDEAWGGSPAERATLKRKRETVASSAPTPAANADVVEVDASGALKRKLEGSGALNFRIGQQSVDSHTRGWGNGSNAAHSKRGALSGRRKLLGFADDDENDRPPFFGSLLRRWQVRACTPETMSALNERLKLSDLRRDAQAISATVSFRRPFARDETLLAYDEDSCEDWGMLDEGEGEDLDHTDDEAEVCVHFFSLSYDSLFLYSFLRAFDRHRPLRLRRRLTTSSTAGFAPTKRWSITRGRKARRARERSAAAAQPPDAPGRRGRSGSRARSAAGRKHRSQLSAASSAARSSSERARAARRSRRRRRREMLICSASPRRRRLSRAALSTRSSVSTRWFRSWHFPRRRASRRRTCRRRRRRRSQQASLSRRHHSPCSRRFSMGRA